MEKTAKQDINKLAQNITKDNLLSQKSATTSFLFNKVVSTTYTKSQLSKRMIILKDFLNFYLFKYQPSQPKQAQANSKVRFEEIIVQFTYSNPNALGESGWLRLLGDDFFRVFTPRNITALYKDLESTINKIDVATLYLPFEVLEDEGTGKTGELHLDSPMVLLGKWFKENVNKYFIFKINYNPNLVAGCAISIHGIFKDFSLGASMHDNQSKIVSTLAQYKRS